MHLHRKRYKRIKLYKLDIGVEIKYASTRRDIASFRGPTLTRLEHSFSPDVYCWIDAFTQVFNQNIKSPQPSLAANSLITHLAPGSETGFIGNIYLSKP